MKKKKWDILLLTIVGFAVWVVLFVNYVKLFGKVYYDHSLRREVLVGQGFIFFLSLLWLICYIFLLVNIIRMRRINEFRTKMVNSIVHELKTPITTINLACQLLGDDSVEKDSNTQHSYLDMISEETKSLQYLVDEALTVIRSRDFFERDYKPVAINQLLRTVANMHQLSLQECHAELRFDLKAQKDMVLGDYPHLSNAFSNLIDNAIKYRNGDLLLEIGTRNVDDKIEIRVADNGIGIDKTNLPFIFEPFTRFNTDNEHYVKGYGLGLNYVKTVVDYHKGNIGVESELFHGTTFFVFLPTMKK